MFKNSIHLILLLLFSGNVLSAVEVNGKIVNSACTIFQKYINDKGDDKIKLSITNCIPYEISGVWKDASVSIRKIIDVIATDKHDEFFFHQGKRKYNELYELRLPKNNVTDVYIHKEKDSNDYKFEEQGAFIIDIGYH